MAFLFCSGCILLTVETEYTFAEINHTAENESYPAWPRSEINFEFTRIQSPKI